MNNDMTIQTSLSRIAGDQGKLWIRGLPLESLAGRLSFTEMAGFLWQDFLSENLPGSSIHQLLGQGRQESFRQLQPLLARAAGLPVLEGIRLGLASLAPGDTPLPFLTTAALPVLLGSLVRLRRGLVPLEPDATLTPTADALRLVQGDAPTPEQERALETYLVTVAEHGLNASTLTARVIASTRSDLLSCIIGAIGALKGPLHGGAPEPVLEMLDALAAAPDPAAWLRQHLVSGQRLMGFGHRIYQVRDPRADILKAALRELHRHQPSPRLALAEQVEALAQQTLAEHKPGRKLDTNVEYYTALLLEALGFPREAFTAVFATGRVLGWIAHFYEQQRSGRLIRPQGEYVEPVPVG